MSIRLYFHLMESLLSLHPTTKRSDYGILQKKTTIEIIEAHDRINIMKFSNDGTHLHTSHGVLQLKSPLHSGSNRELAHTLTDSLYVTGQWITCNMKKLFWLLVDY